METLEDIREELKNMLHNHSIEICSNDLEYLTIEECKVVNLMFCGLPIAGKEITSNAIKWYINNTIKNKQLNN